MRRICAYTISMYTRTDLCHNICVTAVCQKLGNVMFHLSLTVLFIAIPILTADEHEEQFFHLVGQGKPSKCVSAKQAVVRCTLHAVLITEIDLRLVVQSWLEFNPASVLVISFVYFCCLLHGLFISKLQRRELPLFLFIKMSLH